MNTKTNSVIKIFFIIIATSLSFYNLASSAIFICSAILVALAGKVGSLVEFSFGPLKAKLEKNVSESIEILESIKKISLVQAKAILDSAARSGRSSSSDASTFHTLKALDDQLEKLRISKEERTDARAEVVRSAIIDAAHVALGAEYAPSHLPPEARAEWNVLRDYSSIDPDKIESFLQKWGCLDDKRAELIEDIRAMQLTRDIVDEAQFLRTKSRIHWTI
jgi:hypothetical protein